MKNTSEILNKYGYNDFVDTKFYGKLVWGRVRSCDPWWPSQIYNPNKINGLLKQQYLKTTGKVIIRFLSAPRNERFSFQNLTALKEYKANIDEYENQRMSKVMQQRFETACARAKVLFNFHRNLKFFVYEHDLVDEDEFFDYGNYTLDLNSVTSNGETSTPYLGIKHENIKQTENEDEHLELVVKDKKISDSICLIKRYDYCRAAHVDVTSDENNCKFKRRKLLPDTENFNIQIWNETYKSNNSGFDCSDKENERFKPFTKILNRRVHFFDS
jgi:hypothetical protein